MIRMCENTKKSVILLIECLPPLKIPRHLHKNLIFIPEDVQVLVELDPVGQEDPAVPPA